jgi:hypothetical protein
MLVFLKLLQHFWPRTGGQVGPDSVMEGVRFVSFSVLLVVLDLGSFFGAVLGPNGPPKRAKSVIKIRHRTFFVLEVCSDGLRKLQHAPGTSKMTPPRPKKSATGATFLSVCVAGPRQSPPRSSKTKQNLQKISNDVKLFRIPQIPLNSSSFAKPD